MRITKTRYPTYGGNRIMSTELGIEQAARGHGVHFTRYAHPIRLNTATGTVTVYVDGCEAVAA